MNRLVTLLLLALGLTFTAGAAGVQAQGKKYEASWASVDSRPVPAWFSDAKFGIFIHWGVYSVPAFGPKGRYAEWYWNAMEDKNGETWKFHVKNYGASFDYVNFAPRFTAELFNPDYWASVFVDSGAKYVVLTSKHHEGYTLWPSAQSPGWNSMEVGPKRDLCGELTDAVKKRGLKMGFYYSLYEWYNPLYRSNPKRYVDEHMLPQFKDLVTRYKPSILFADGEWDRPSEEWRSTEFLQWLYNESGVKDDVVVNDRWGKESRSKHGGYYTTEYGEVGAGTELAAGRPWEECRGIGASFGYNRNEDLADYKSGADLIQQLVSLVSKGGNLLLDIGPTADGRIPVIMQERLHEIGSWLKINGEAIYGTRPWKTHNEGKTLFFTSKGDTVYAHSFGWPGESLSITIPKMEKSTVVTLLGTNDPLKWKQKDGKLVVSLPSGVPAAVSGQPAFVFKIVPGK
jgi:alpha-L-fucosidase